MTTSKNGRLIYVHKWLFESHGCAENYQPITNECAENYQPITNKWSLESRGCGKNYFVEFNFYKIMQTS